MAGSQHPGDALQELLDGRLAGEQREAVERHLHDCARCQRERDQLLWTRRVARAVVAEPAPEGLQERLSAALDAEDAGETAPGPAAQRSRPASWPVWAGLAAALLLVAVWYLWPSVEVDIPAELASDFSAYREGTLPLEIVASDVGEVERYLEQHLDFEARVFDLAMMEYLPVGGRVHDAGGAPSALFVYRGPDGRILVCQMFRGRLEELPTEGERRVNDGIEFQIYEREGKTVVAWQEGEVVCVLVSDIPREQVIQLAFAKAVKV